MASRDEHADILGGPILQRPESGVFATFSQYLFVFKSAALLGVGLLVWIACARGLEHLKRHRELRYKKAMRRKHGIPDSDCRPFAVAYAAARRAHLEREAQDRNNTANYVSGHNPPAANQQTNAQRDACLLRKRVPEPTMELHDHHFGKQPHGLLSLDSTDRYNPSSRHRVVVPQPLPVERSPICRASRRGPVTNLNNSEESRKRSFEDESDVERETLKKSRIDDDELVREDQADWYAQYGDTSSQRGLPKSPNRQLGGNCIHTSGQERSNHLDDHHDEDHEADEAMEDEVAELEAVARGKKRDRAEAGSTFGGDDEEDFRNGRASHRRKRRTILQRSLEMPARGQKRDREVESPESGGDSIDSETFWGRAHRCSKKKKGKKAASDEANGMPMGNSHVSEDPLCGGRRIGESWEADGVRYKVGDKGERLRQTLVKKARNRYHMPQDSQHPDRSAALEIYVEMWMTEEQYKQAEVRQELAWQEVPSEASASKTLDVFHSPTKDGKSLLWDSVKYSPARRPLRQFISSGASTRVNFLEHWQSQPILGRRVASSSTIVSPILPGDVGSPTRPGYRGFSKWEKQDREAEAMTRIRAKIEEQRKTRASPQKSVETLASVAPPEPGCGPLPIPTITLTPAPAAEEKLDGNTPQSKSSSSTFSFATPSSANNSVKGAVAVDSTSTRGTSPSPTSNPPTIPSTLFPGAPAAPATTSLTSTLSPFPFVKPPQVLPSTLSATVSSSTLPNISEEGTAAGTPSSSVSLSSTLGAATQPQPPSAESASKPVSFSFVKPDVSPTVATPATKNQLPTSSVTPSSSLSPVSLGFTPATAKAETPIPPVSTSSKPIAPIFSFPGASPSAATFPTSSTPSTLKFSFGQPSLTSTLAPDLNSAPGIGSQPKPTFKFGQALAGTTDGISAVSAVDESRKSATPASIFSTTGGSNESTKHSSFGAITAFGSASFKPPSTNLFGKPAAVDGGSSTTPSTKSQLTPFSAAASASIISSTTARDPSSGNALVFSFGGVNSSSKSIEGPKPATLFRGDTRDSTFDSSSTEGKSTFTFGAATDGTKPMSSFGGNIENSKAPSVFGGLTERRKPTFAFGGPAEGSKSTFTFNGATENKATSGAAPESTKQATSFTAAFDSSRLPDTTGPSIPTSASGSAMFGAFSSASPLTSGRDDTATASIPTPTSTQIKSGTSFSFEVPSGATGSMFSQPSAFATSGDSIQSVFGKPTNTTPGAFGFAGPGVSSLSNTLTFGKPSTQNQKQEQ